MEQKNLGKYRVAARIVKSKKQGSNQASNINPPRCLKEIIEQAVYIETDLDI